LTRKFTKNVLPGRLFTFKLGGTAEMPAEMVNPIVASLTTLPHTGEPLEVGRGLNIYIKFCITCHGSAFGAGGGALPDLTHSSEGVFKNHKEIILNGALAQNGMPSFKGRLTDQDVEDVGHFLKYTSETLRSGADPRTLLTNLAGMQYMADTAPRKD